MNCQSHIRPVPSSPRRCSFSPCVHGHVIFVISSPPAGSTESGVRYFWVGMVAAEGSCPCSASCEESVAAFASAEAHEEIALPQLMSRAQAVVIAARFKL